MMAASPPAITASLRRPPGPKGHFLLGNLAAVSRDWLGFYSRCAKEYGDVVQLRYLHVPICLLMHPRDIEYVTKLARKARELNKVFQIHQNVLNAMAECNSLLRGLIGEDK